MKNIFLVFFSLVILFFSEGINNPVITKKKEDQTYNSTASIHIIFMLPLFFNFVKEEKINQESKRLSVNALYFYLGAKSAIDFLLFKKKK
ncbi:hypothetical protein [Blattabacterium cuenoti]|uniref:hypothetical protein n=1 Tax=Blattabacterium cuenoti TaxID=1653831 RepID=UPI001EECBAF1|nr:hypothetical protein [Blattabacterium cuenoti]